MIGKGVVALATAPNVETLWRETLVALQGFGIDRLFYGSTYERSGEHLGDPNEFVLLTNHDPSYVETYLSRRYYLTAPMVQWALRQEGVCSWAWMHERAASGALTTAEREVYEFNARHGVVAGYQISFPAVNSRHRVGMGLTLDHGSQADLDRVWAHSGDDILAICHVLNLRLHCMPRPSRTKPLTYRQREVLAWIGDGKSIADIAILMDLTQATIEKHLRLARDALGAETTAQAVLRASLQNQLFSFEFNEAGAMARNGAANGGNGAIKGSKASPGSGPANTDGDLRPTAAPGSHSAGVHGQDPAHGATPGSNPERR